MNPFSLEDQHGKTHGVDESTRLILFSRDKALSKLAFAELEGRTPTFLADRHALMALDISPMPRLITWAFAKPKMRKRPLPILLDAVPGPTKDFPSKEKTLTLIFLDKLSVAKVAYVTTASELAQELDALSS